MTKQLFPPSALLSQILYSRSATKWLFCKSQVLVMKSKLCVCVLNKSSCCFKCLNRLTVLHIYRNKGINVLHVTVQFLSTAVFKCDNLIIIFWFHTPFPPAQTSAAVRLIQIISIVRKVNSLHISYDYIFIIIVFHLWEQIKSLQVKSPTDVWVIGNCEDFSSDSCPSHLTQIHNYKLTGWFHPESKTTVS